ncbi:MAG: hypothetical protein QXY55_06915, partial [Candidatus Korarchaeota archaeon]
VFRISFIFIGICGICHKVHQLNLRDVALHLMSRGFLKGQGRDGNEYAGIILLFLISFRYFPCRRNTCYQGFAANFMPFRQFTRVF